MANGINSSAVNSGVIIGPILGGFIYEAINIQAPFLIGGLLGLILLPVVMSVPGIQEIDTVRKWDVPIPKASNVRRIVKTVLVPQVISLSLIHFMQLDD